MGSTVLRSLRPLRSSICGRGLLTYPLTSAHTMERESSIAAFMSLTGADAVAAESYLEMANGVVETAVNLFLETSGGLAQDQQFKYSDEFSAATAIASDQISYGGNDRELQEVHVRAPDEQKRLRLMDPLLDSARAESTHQRAS